MLQLGILQVGLPLADICKVRYGQFSGIQSSKLESENLRSQNHGFLGPRNAL